MDPIKSVKALGPQHAASLWGEFKNFAFKGNVIDLAVGVIIGAAFGKIIDSLVKHIIMPAISLVMPGEQSYLEWKLIVGQKEIPYGLFLGEVVNFLIVALVLFLIIKKVMGLLMKEKKQEAAAPPPPTKDPRKNKLLKFNVDGWCSSIHRGSQNVLSGRERVVRH